MRNRLLISLLLLGSCATTREPIHSEFNPSGAPSITLGPGWVEGRPVLSVSIANRSNVPICIRADALQNPGSYEMDIRLRDDRGRRVSLYPAHGSFPEPLSEVIQLDSGASVQGQFYLDRFRRLGRNRPLPNGWRAQAGFQYGDCHPVEAYCDGRLGQCPDAWSSRAASAWEPLSFSSRE